MADNITLILGCMNSGKTSTLLTHARKRELIGSKVLYLKSSKDDRYDDKKDPAIVTHDGIRRKCILIDTISPDIEKMIEENDVTVIDEFQFLPDEVVDIIEKWADKGKIFIIAGLDSTSDRTAFPIISKIFPKAGDKHFETALCLDCKGTACFSSKLVKNDLIIDVGGADKFKSTCRNCYVRNIKKLEKQLKG